MKLKCEFQLMDMDDTIVAVPVGDNAEIIHGVIRLNSSASDIMKLLEEETTEEEVIENLSKEYVLNDEMRSFVHEFIGELAAAGVLK